MLLRFVVAANFSDLNLAGKKSPRAASTIDTPHLAIAS